MIKYHNINGELVPAKDALVPVFDVGLLRGYGIFDFFPIRQRQPLFVEDYFDRFYRSAHAMNLPTIDRSVLLDRVIGLCAANDIQEGNIKLVLTGGTSTDGYTPNESNLYILQHGPVHYDEHFYSEGVRLLLQKFGRDQPLIKSLNYSNALRNRPILERQSAIDLLYHDGRLIRETSRANFFIIDGQRKVRTSLDSTLNGITRKHVIKVARSMGYEVIEMPLPLELITTAQEAFITSTTKALLPVFKVNDHTIAEGKNMPITNQLRQGFRAYVDAYLSSKKNQ